jgi:hypothetical protein
MNRSACCAWLAAVTAALASAALAAEPNPNSQNVPGVVIDHLPASAGSYIGSPSIAILPNGDYVASHDHFGPKSTEHQSALTSVFASSDRGKTWHKRAAIDGQFWSTLFVHRGTLYVMGTHAHYGRTIIRRSSDGGRTWSSPHDKRSGLLRDDGRFHCAPMPVVTHNGRLWRAMEEIVEPRRWGVDFRAFLMSAPLDADLLRADSWTCTNSLGRDPSWLRGQFGGWLEGNAVVSREGTIVDILRVDTPGYPEKAAIVSVSLDGKTASFDPRIGFINFPGGAKKFTIRYDAKSDLYWSLANIVPEREQSTAKPASVRNTLALTCSANLREWAVRCIVLHHADPAKHAFQYVDWQFDAEDLVIVSRTAYDDGLRGAHNFHDANYLTFHRIADFRRLNTREGQLQRNQRSARVKLATAQNAQIVRSAAIADKPAPSSMTRRSASIKGVKGSA